ncbi:3-dehydroquinate synthase [Longimicrobium sp.]|uniref:3-dehydroquinate synthase n=1 Tax=Longimicrobium sp. TaxID=2029185 RepID=UPI002B90EE2D|nr:3-dehydroquinate synthase [Longimicrobium sp.]HSU17039.1 3-dehydroquinate synthase [Longimicrobium sp.]
MSSKQRIAIQLPERPGRGYEILVGSGLFSTLATILSRFCPAHRYAVVTDDRVAELYAVKLSRMLHSAGYRADVFAFQNGEERKTRDTWGLVGDAMLEAGIGRDAALIAFGGGVPGDLGGFVAATYMRGLPLVQVPTTLLAMIDSSVGGKTGVDTPAGKNLVGAFHQPHVVVADPDLLHTLPDAHIRAGLAEAVKHGAIADPEYLEWIESAAADLLAGDTDALTRLIVRSVEIKAEIVKRDETETGPRKLLNFGHTIGHAIEALSGYALLHGEAVAIGMVEEARIGERCGITAAGTSARLRKALTRLGLPTSLPLEMNVEEVVDWTRADKKAREGRVEYALIEAIGAPAVGRDGRYGSPVADETVMEVLGGVGNRA